KRTRSQGLATRTASAPKAPVSAANTSVGTREKNQSSGVRSTSPKARGKDATPSQTPGRGTFGCATAIPRSSATPASVLRAARPVVSFLTLGYKIRFGGPTREANARTRHGGTREQALRAQRDFVRRDLLSARRALRVRLSARHGRLQDRAAHAGGPGHHAVQD